MNGWLLLSDGVRGVTRRVRGVEIADGPAEQAPQQLTVGRAIVDGSVTGDLAVSARRGAEAALRLLSREYGRDRSLMRVSVDLEPSTAEVVGRSGELLFAMVTFLEAARGGLGPRMPTVAFAATGALDTAGNVGSVQALDAKIEAALAGRLGGEGGILLHPQVDAARIDAGLRARCRAAGVELRPVARLEDALAHLGIPLRGGWTGSPFRALELFERGHSRIFFGRQAETARLVAMLERREAAGRPGGLVVGASGAGKSSFCLAGLVPALAATGHPVAHATWRPRDAAVAAEGRLIEPADIARSVIDAWRRQDAGQEGFDVPDGACGLEDLEGLADLLAPRGARDVRRVWIVDQFEELFTLDFSPAARQAFGQLLRRLQAHGVWVVGTLRNEFYGAYQDLLDADGRPILVEVFGPDGLFDLPRMGRDALRQVIVRPAELAGLLFETRAADAVRLDDRLLSDALEADDALPLLEFGLQELYERRQSDPTGPEDTVQRLTFAAYDAIGGLQGAIGAMAEAAFSSLDPAAQEALPQLLAALAAPSDGDRRETARPARLDNWPIGSPVRRLADALVAVRVLVRDDRHIRVAHEALFTHWGEAGAALQASRQTRELIAGFTAREARWRQGGRPDEWLLSSPRDLDDARSLRVHTSGPDLEGLRRYLETSLAVGARRLQDEADQRQAALRAARRRTATFAVLSAVLALAVILAGYQTAQANQSSRVARTAQATATRNEASARVETARAEEQRSQAVAAVAERDKANAGLRRALADLGRQQGLTLEEQDRALAQESRALAALADNLRERGDPAAAVALARQALPGPRRRPWTPEAEGALSRAVAENRLLFRLRGHTDGITDVQFTPDGRWIVSSSLDRTIRVWPVGSPDRPPRVLRLQERVARMWITADSRKMLTHDLDGIVVLWSLEAEDGAPKTLFRVAGSLRSLAVDVSGTHVTVLNSAGRLTLWRVDGDTPELIGEAVDKESTAVAVFGAEPRVVSYKTFHFPETEADRTAGTPKLWFPAAGKTLTPSSLSVATNPAKEGQNAAACGDGTFVHVTRGTPPRVFDLTRSTEPAYTLDDPSPVLGSFRFSPDCEGLARSSVAEFTTLLRIDGRFRTISNHLQNPLPFDRYHTSNSGTVLLTQKHDGSLDADFLGTWSSSVRIHGPVPGVTSPRAALSGDGRTAILVQAGNVITGVSTVAPVDIDFRHRPVRVEGVRRFEDVSEASGRTLVTPWSDKKLHLVIADQSQAEPRRHLLQVISHGVYPVMSPDGRMVAYAEPRSHRIAIWRWRDGFHPMPPIDPAPEPIKQLSATNDRVAMSHDHGVCILTFATSRACTPRTLPRGAFVFGAEFGAGGRLLLVSAKVGDRFEAIVLDEADATRPPIRIPLPAPVMLGELSGNGRYAALYLSDKVLRVVDLRSPNPQVELPSGDTRYSSLAFDAEGDTLVAATAEGVQAWSPRGGRWVSTLDWRLPFQISDVAVREGRIEVLGPDGLLSWRLPSGNELRQAGDRIAGTLSSD